MAELQAWLNMTPFGIADYRRFVRQLAELAQQTDRGIVLAEALVELLRQQRIIIPALDVIERVCSEALTRGTRQMYEALTALLADHHRRALDGLLAIREGTKGSAAWSGCGKPPGPPKPKHVLAHLERLKTIRELWLPDGLEHAIHQNRLPLGLMEPQSSGLGGGAFLVYYEAKTGKVTVFDGRETAPSGATPAMLIGTDGKPLSYTDAVTSGRSTGTPGAIAMLGLVHERYGKLPWRDLFGTATRAAEDGFTVPKRLGRFAGGNFPQAGLPDAKPLFSRPDGTPVQAGDRLTNAAYGKTLRTIATQGPRTLLQGPIAEQIAARTHEEPRPGTLTAQGPRRVPAARGRSALPTVSHLRRVRATAAVERRLAAADAGNPG